MLKPKVFLTSEEAAPICFVLRNMVTPRCEGGDRMRRRDLIILPGGAMTAAPALRAQQKAIQVIGFLGSDSPARSPHL